MTNAPARFTQVDVKRALKAARAIDADLRVRIEPDGAITLLKAADIKHEKPIEASAEIRL